MEKVIAVGFTNESSFIFSLIDVGQVIIKKLSDGRLGISCNTVLTDNEASFIESRKSAVDHWPMPGISKPDSFFDFRDRFQNPENGSIIIELKAIQRKIQRELFELLCKQLEERGYELEYDSY